MDDTDECAAVAFAVGLGFFVFVALELWVMFR